MFLADRSRRLREAASCSKQTVAEAFAIRQRSAIFGSQTRSGKAWFGF